MYAFADTLELTIVYIGSGYLLIFIYHVKSANVLRHVQCDYRKLAVFTTQLFDRFPEWTMK